MANEGHRKIFVAEAALDFDANFAEIDDLPAGDLCWCKPITTMEDCEYAEIFAAISGGDATPAGSISFFAGRAGTNLRAAAGYGNTLTDHGTEGTAADIANILNCLEPLDGFALDETANVLYTLSFKFWYPGADWQLFIYNNSDEILDGTGSPHSVYARGWGPELQ